jgi:hypothetical protein
VTSRSISTTRSAGDGFGWSSPGKWRWTIEIGHPRDLPRLRNIFAKIVLLCESVGVTQPQHLPVAQVDVDVRWLGGDSSLKSGAIQTCPPQMKITCDER